MPPPDSISPPRDGVGGGWLLLGILNEIFLRLVNQPDLRSFWEEVCVSVRWIVRFQRVCVVLSDDGGAARVAARHADERLDEGAMNTGVVVDAWMTAALTAQRPAWFSGPWDEVRRVDAPRAWLTEGDPEVILHVPIQARKKTIGSLLFAMQKRDIERSVLASTTSFALYVGATYTMLSAASQLAAAGEQLKEQNAELERVHLELRAQLDVVRAQHQAMLRMSTPIIQVGESVLALPIIGAVDPLRAARMMEEVLEAIVQHSARYLVLDLTGAELAEASSVEHLVRIIAAAKLLGSECVVSGVPARVAPQLLEVGDLRGVPIFSNLRRALEHTMKALARNASQVAG